MRRRLGIGLFVTALGTMHFLETYLAAIFYVELWPGTIVSPGSSVLFAGKLVLLLLVYIKEDAATVRQPIYGLLVGNLFMVGAVLLLRLHDVTGAGRGPDLGFLDEMGWLMVWGTLLLYVDAIAIVLIYERLGRYLGRRVALRIWASASLVLTFDQVCFFSALHFVSGVPFAALLGGWYAKMAAAASYAALAGLYLRVFERERPARRGAARIWDVFEVLTYRERYHELLEQAGRDPLTGAFNRARLDAQGRQSVDLALSAGRPASVMVLDLDRFKSINDRLGHAGGDVVLKHVAAAIGARLDPADYLFRYGGDEFVVISTDRPPEDVVALAGEIAAAIRRSVYGETVGVSASIGVATGPREGENYEALFLLADTRLYAGKRIERRRVLAYDEILATADRLSQGSRPENRAGPDLSGTQRRGTARSGPFGAGRPGQKTG